MEFPFLRSGFNYDRDAASDEAGLKCEDVSLAKQSFAEEVDINTIVRRFGLTGELPSDVRMPTYGDFEAVYDFHGAMNLVAEARQGFESLPAEVRARFHNDPGELLEFCGDEKNREEAVKLGIAKASLPPEPAPGAAAAVPGSTPAPPK